MTAENISRFFKDAWLIQQTRHFHSHSKGMRGTIDFFYPAHEL